jgi:hypothetical protein
MTQFDSEVELEVVVDQSSVRDARDEIEDAVGDVAVGVGSSGTSGTAQLTGGSGGRDVTDHTSELVSLGKSRNDLLRDLVDAQEQGNFDRALGGGGGGALGGALLGLGAIGGLGAGLVTFLQNYEFEPPNIPPIDVPEALDPVDVPVPTPLDPVDVPVPGALDPVELPVPDALDPIAIPEPEWLPIEVPAPGESPAPSETPAPTESPAPSPSPSPAPTDDRTTDDTPALITNPMAEPNPEQRPTGETGAPDPQNQPAPAPTSDPSGGGSGIPRGAVTTGEAVTGGIVGAGGAALGAYLAGTSGGPATRRAAFSRETPTASNTESINDRPRPANITVENNVTAESVSQRDLEEAMEQAKREAKREITKQLSRSLGSR